MCATRPAGYLLQEAAQRGREGRGGERGKRQTLAFLCSSSFGCGVRLTMRRGERPTDRGRRVARYTFRCRSAAAAATTAAAAAAKVGSSTAICEHCVPARMPVFLSVCNPCSQSVSLSQFSKHRCHDMSLSLSYSVQGRPHSRCATNRQAGIQKDRQTMLLISPELGRDSIARKTCRNFHDSFHFH